MSKEFVKSEAISPPQQVISRTNVRTLEEYEQMWQRSIDDPEAFWAEQAKEFLHWEKPWNKVLSYDFNEGWARWFEGGKTNVSYNCLDRNLKSWRRNKAAIIWESDEGQTKIYTYQSLYYRVCRFANVLKKHGIKKGDRVAIYLPMIPEIAIAMLACARIGAIHTIVFSGFSASSLRDRIRDCGAKILITADAGLRGGRFVPLKAEADIALEECPSIEKVIVVARLRIRVNMEPKRDLWYHEETRAPDIASHCEAEWMDATDPLFILYTSGSTGKPKGVVHSTGGYLLQAAMTFKYTFDYHDNDVFFCTADCGWVTGHSYVVYGPLCTGATSLMFEGIPTFPDPGRFWQVIEKHGVNIFYTAPTAIRSLEKLGDEWPHKYNLSSLRVLGTVGEPINIEAWNWYFKTIGMEECSICDTYWQTETGGHVITNLAGCTPMKPGSAARPFFGVLPRVLNQDKTETPVGEDGRLVIEKPWPGMLTGLWDDADHRRTREVYFSAFPGYYFTGDGAAIDDDGYIWMRGRVDDVINVSGHCMSTVEVEGTLTAHLAVNEAAVVGFPHAIKGESIYCYVILNEGYEPSEQLEKILAGHVRRNIGPIARPDIIHFVSEMPKTRSGKIMRRILRKIAAGEKDVNELGDITTLAEPEVVQTIIDSSPLRR